MITPRRWLFERLIIGDGSRLSKEHYNEALSYDEALGQRFLARVLQEAVDHVPHYRQPGITQSPPSLDQFPVLGKVHLRDHHESLISETADRTRLRHITTSGSTGMPIQVMHDQTHLEWVRTTEDYFFREFLNVEPGQVPQVVFWANSASIWGQRRDLRKKLSLWLTQTSLLGASRFTHEEFVTAVETINWRKPVLIKSYATTLFELARYIREHNVRIHHPRLIVSLAEMLQPHVRSFIEEVFGCPIFDFYAARETGPLAGQCAHGRMHTFAFHAHLEVVANGAPAPVGEEGTVLVTQLHNLCMPLIRYELGDAAVVGEPCPCGRALPTLDRIAGRLIDYFPTTDGTLVYGGYFSRLLYYQPWIKEYQVTQRELDHVCIRFVSLAPPTAGEIAHVEKQIRFVMGDGCRIDWERLDDIPMTTHGKRIHTVSLVRGSRW